MKELFQKNKKILMFVGIFVAVFLVYTLFIKKEDVPDLTIEQATSSEAANDNRELLEQLQSLNSITLNSEIFNSKIFNLLQDNTIIIENKRPEGRQNPFLPIGYDNASFTPDQQIQGATINTNGLLEQAQKAGSGSIPTPGSVPQIKEVATSTAQAN